MKRRVIKKNVNRFITPFIKGLPKTVYGSNSVVVDVVGYFEKSVAVNKSHMIKNGEVVAEGCRPSIKCHDVLANIRRTGEVVQTIIAKHEHVLLRTGPTIHGNDIRIRLITE